MLAARVADRVQAHRNRDPAGQRDEETAQRIERQIHPRQRNQPADMQRAHRAEHRQQANPHPNRAQAGRHDPGHDRSETVVVHRVRRRGGSRGERGRHFPVTDRNAATIWVGVGGQPGISTSTGTTSPTAPTTP